jgi:hypothetical protein
VWGGEIGKRKHDIENKGSTIQERFSLVSHSPTEQIHTDSASITILPGGRCVLIAILHDRVQVSQAGKKGGGGIG